MPPKGRPKKQPTKRLVVKIPIDVATQLDADSYEQDTPVSSIVRRALEEYYSRRGKVFDVSVQWGNHERAG